MANTLSYPGLERITDNFIAQAIRFIWDKLFNLEGLIKAPTTGTLNPDQKPTSPEEGAKFFASDFSRLYRFSSSTWTDDVTAPSRFEVSFFFATPEPSVGWARCDGSSVLRSTSSGGVLYFATPIIPVLNGLQAWMRI